MSVVREWRGPGIGPAGSTLDLHLRPRESSKFSTDPQLEAKLTDIFELYLNFDAERGCGLRVHSEGRVQALDHRISSFLTRLGTGHRAD